MDLEAPNFALEAPRQRFNDALNTVATAARGALATNEFYDLVAIRLSEAVQAVAVAIWSVNASGEITLARGFQLDKVGLLDDPSGQAEHQLLLQRVVDGGPAQVVEPHFKEHGEGAGNPTPLTLLLGPLMIDQKVDAVLEVFQRPDVPGSTQALQLRFLLQICGLASDYLRTAELRQLAARQSLGEHVESYVQEVHRNLDTRPTCYAIANEGRRLIECDRLSVAIKQGRRFVVEAVSGQDTFNARASEIVALNRLATAVGRAGDEIWYAGDAADLPPQIEEVLQSYVDISHAVTVTAVPLRRSSTMSVDDPDEKPREEPVVGVMIAETYQDWDVSSGYRRRIALAKKHGSAALANTFEHQSLFLMPVWRTLGRLGVVTRARSFPKYATIGAAIVLALVALCFIPADFELSGKGTLEPVVKRNVFADLSGTVTEINADHGHVAAGAVLATIDSTDAKSELLRLQGERDSKLQEQLTKDRMVKDPKLTEAERNRTWSDIEALKTTLASLNEQIALIKKEKIARAQVTSPIDGDIITWQVRDKLDHRPVEKGQILMTVAALDQPWNLEIRIPEDRIGQIREAVNKLPRGETMPVSFILASDPAHRHHGTLKEINPAAEIHGDEGNVVLLRVAINKDEVSELRPGAGVVAKFYCGRRSVAYVWFHDVMAFVESKILF